MKHLLFPGVLAIAVVVAFVGGLWREGRQPHTSMAAAIPAPTDGGPGERDENGESFRHRRQEWLDGMLQSAPDVDPHRIDGQFRANRAARQQRERADKLDAGYGLDSLKSFSSPSISGVWRERGSSNQAGRTNAYVRDESRGRGVVLSDGGNLWLGGSDGFTSVNDSASFLGGFIERLIRNGSDRLVLPSHAEPFGVHYSDDWGVSFAASTGLSGNGLIRGFAVRDPDSADVYLLRGEFDQVTLTLRPRLWHSESAGETFTDLGFLDSEERSTALFSPRYDSTEVFLLTGPILRRIVPGTQKLQLVGQVPIGDLDDLTRLHLTGGVSAAGQVFLYVLASYGRYDTGTTVVWRSLDGGVTFQQRGTAPTGTFWYQSAESSTRDPNVLLIGGIDLFRSADGGFSFARVNGWQEYYQNPSDKLHADIMNIDFYRDATGAEGVWISTDGGTYYSSDGAVTVQNQSLTSGLNVGQYYSTYTRRDAPHTLMAGSQDQGYQRVIDPPTQGVLAMEQIISGDYNWLSTTDGGNTVWMVYPGFAMVDRGGQLPIWEFADNGLVGESFFPPLAAAPGQPNRALIGGGRVTGAVGHQVLELTLNNDIITHTADPFIFPVEIGAVSYGETIQTRYVLDYKGTFWRSEAGLTFIPIQVSSEFFRGTDILLDPAKPGRIYVSGTGYSDPGVYVSEDGGLSFTGMAAGLPSTLVSALGISADGRHLFAATRVGAFYFDGAIGRWIDLTTAGAPNQWYTDIDYIDSLGVARFSTYGRGIWDFAVAGAATGPQDEPSAQQFALPQPNPPNSSCPAGYFTATITDGPGPGIKPGIFGMELLLDEPGTRILAGGLNFGGLIDVSQVGFAGANIANAIGEDQLLNLSVSGNPTANPSGNLPVRITINRRSGSDITQVFQESAQINGNAPYTASVRVSPGYYETLVAADGFPASAAGGPPEGQFFFSLTTQFVDRLGGGFQGGAVVGGYHASNPFGGVSGFASFCIATPHASTTRVFAAPTYGPNGAGDLRLQLRDAQQSVIYSVP